MSIRIALPSKGRISGPAVEILEKAGIGLVDNSNRKLFSQTFDPEITVMFTRAADIPEYVKDGAADIGITGYDLVKEKNLDGIDIIGDDCYTSLVKDVKGIVTMFKDRISNNFGHIAENDGSYTNTPSLILASIANHGGYSLYDLITSPFFVGGDTSKNVDQGIILFKDNTRDQFVYKAHYDATKSIINGLTKAGYGVYTVSPADFMAFNVNKDYPEQNANQTISSTNVRINFTTNSGAVGFAIDHGSYMDVYFTGNSTIVVSNGSVRSVKSGSYNATGTFTPAEISDDERKTVADLMARLGL